MSMNGSTSHSNDQLQLRTRPYSKQNMCAYTLIGNTPCNILACIELACTVHLKMNIRLDGMQSRFFVTNRFTAFPSLGL